MSNTVVILAGGASSRMGRDKAKLPYGNKILIEYMVELYRTYFDRVIVSVDRKDRFELSNVDIVIDEYKNIGPLSGIYSVFNQTSIDEFFLTAIDIPFGDPFLAKKIVDFGQGYSACVLKRSSGYYEPLFAMYDRNSLHKVKYCIENKQYSLANLFEDNRVRILEEEELSHLSSEPIDKVFINTNRFHEYVKVLQETNWLTEDIKNKVGLNEAVNLLLNCSKKLMIRNIKENLITVSTLSNISITEKYLEVEEFNDSIKVMEALADAAQYRDVSMIVAVDKKDSEVIYEALKTFGAPTLFHGIDIDNGNNIIGANLGGVPLLLFNGKSDEDEINLDYILKEIINRLR